MNSQLPETLGYCKYARRWIIYEYPQKCFKDCVDCENCEYYEKRSLNRYITRRLQKLAKENSSQKI